MSPFLAFLLGVLAGWLLLSAIGWVYLRRRNQSQIDTEASLHQKVIMLDRELVAVKSEMTVLQEKASLFEPEKVHHEELIYRMEQELGELRLKLAVPPLLVPDNLEEIQGIGPAIAKKLNRAGVHTFEQLAAQDPGFLRSVLGRLVERLADEELLLEQARQLANHKRADVQSLEPPQ